jgi:hypothetical protein
MIHRTLNTKVDHSKSLVNGELTATDVVVNKSLTVTGSITARTVITDTILCDDTLYAKTVKTVEMGVKMLTTTDLMADSTTTAALFVTKTPTDEYAVGFVGASKVIETTLSSGESTQIRTIRLNKGTFIVSYSFTPINVGEVTVSDYEVAVFMDSKKLTAQRSSTSYSTSTTKNFIVSGSCICVAPYECYVSLMATVNFTTFSGSLGVGPSELITCRII